MMLFVNISVCGLDADIHTLRMRKVQYPITDIGYCGDVAAPVETDTYIAGMTDIITFAHINMSEEIAYYNTTSDEYLETLQYNYTQQSPYINMTQYISSTDVD